MDVAELKSLLIQSIDLQSQALGKNDEAKNSMEEAAGVLQNFFKPENNNLYTDLIVGAADKVLGARGHYVDADCMIGDAYAIVSKNIDPKMTDINKFGQFFEVGQAVLSSYGNLRLRIGDVEVALAGLHRIAAVRAGDTIENIIGDVNILIAAADETTGLASQLIPMTQAIHDVL